MIPRSLGVRSVLAALLAIVVALVIVAVGVDVLVGRHLHRSLDSSLRQRAVEVAQLSATAPALLVSPGSLDAPAGGTQVVTQVVDRRGRIVARSLGLGGRVLPIGQVARNVIESGRARYIDVRSTPCSSSTGRGSVGSRWSSAPPTRRVPPATSSLGCRPSRSTV
jgi:hypothetical protein